MSSRRSLTRSQARSLLSMARLKIARSRFDRAISKRTRMDQTCFGSRGFFWPMSNPLFQGRWPRSTLRTSIEGPPPPRPPRRSIASVSFIPTERSGFPVSVLATGHFTGPLAASLINFGNAAANSGTSRFRSLGRGLCRPLGRRINDDLHTELAEGSHPRHLGQIGCPVDGNRKM
jgi:hypothetical protein